MDPLGYLFLVNSTVASVVELVWRFYHFPPIVPGVEVDPTVFDQLDRFWALVGAVDPRVDLDRSISLWQAIVEEWM